MTNEEAKRILNPDHENVWRGAKECGGVEIVADACRVAVKALDKQIPKKAICANKTTGHNICPNCGLFVLSGTMHCGKCGQALDWSENSDG